MLLCVVGYGEGVQGRVEGRNVPVGFLGQKALSGFQGQSPWPLGRAHKL